jgi:N-acetylmuramoyl-L-alanine amidase
MKVRNHRLVLDSGAQVPFRQSPHQGATLSPEYLVIHYTAGASAESSIEWFLRPEAKASAHLVIGRSGSITQLVRFDRVAWHAGKSRWADRVGLNAWSIGIELDNAGQLVRHPDGWRTKWGRSVSPTDVIEDVHKNGGPLAGWHAYTKEQLEVAQVVAAVLVSHYGLKDVIGHDDIAPARKTDPGPAFPMSSFRAAAIGRSDEGDDQGAEEYKTRIDLNIRIGPGSQYDKLSVSPLPTGTRLRRLSDHGVWMEVQVADAVHGDVDIEGWVHGGFVQPA